MAAQEQKTVLIAISNSITSGRISTIMKEKGWICKKTSDGDETVDQYVKIKPEIVFIGLNLSTINGHVAALEIREIDPNARIIFVSSKTRLSKVQDAAYSAGAVGILTTPLTKSQLNEKWDKFFLEIPDAPGLADLDELYPEIIHKKEVEISPPPPPLLPPLSQNLPLPNISLEKKGKRKWKRIIFTLITISSLTLIIFYTELIDLSNII
jgi:CheY-like chemotaxis protein